MTTANLILNAARKYLYAEARFCAWDNHDDMHDSENWEHTFTYLTKGKVPIEDFIREHLAEEVPKARAEAVEGYDEEEYEGVFDSFDERFGGVI